MPVHHEVPDEITLNEAELRNLCLEHDVEWDLDESVVTSEDSSKQFTINLYTMDSDLAFQVFEQLGALIDERD